MNVLLTGLYWPVMNLMVSCAAQPPENKQLLLKYFSYTFS